MSRIFARQNSEKEKNTLPSEGFEPSIPYGHRILSAVRIPVPTQGQANDILAGRSRFIAFHDFTGYTVVKSLSLCR